MWLAGGAAQSIPCIATIGSSEFQVSISREWTVTSQLAGCHGWGWAGLPSNVSTNALGACVAIGACPSSITTFVGRVDPLAPTSLAAAGVTVDGLERGVFCCAVGSD